jgi:hypothetical protein
MSKIPAIDFCNLAFGANASIDQIFILRNGQAKGCLNFKPKVAEEGTSSML